MSKADWERLARSADETALMRAIKDNCGKPAEFLPEPDAVDLIGDYRAKLRVLDFGCGLGRNLLALRSASSHWEVYGYDLPPMIDRAQRYLPQRLPYKALTRPVAFRSDWELLRAELRADPVDVVLAVFVFQHIDLQTLKATAADLREMVKPGGSVVVRGRRWMDDGTPDTFTVLSSALGEPRSPEPGTYPEWTPGGGRLDHFTVRYTIGEPAAEPGGE